MALSSSDKVISATKSWLEDFVIKYGLCPFAGRVFFNNNIYYRALPFGSPEPFLHEIDIAIHNITVEDSPHSTALIIVSKGLESFDDYLTVYHHIEQYIDEGEYADIIQCASFHPQYIFADVDPDDISNYTNRSPYPIIHLLLREEVSKAIDSYPDIHSIAPNNIKKMNGMGRSLLLDITTRYIAASNNN